MTSWVFGTPVTDALLWFAPEDASFLAALERHLVPLAETAPVLFWHVGKTLPGESEEHTRARHLQAADLIVVLVSPHLLASPVFHDEATVAFDRRDRGEVAIVPVVVRSCDWRSTALAELQVLPGGVPVGQPDRDPAWLEVIEGLRHVLDSMPPSPPQHSG